MKSQEISVSRTDKLAKLLSANRQLSGAGQYPWQVRTVSLLAFGTRICVHKRSLTAIYKSLKGAYQ